MVILDRLQDRINDRGQDALPEPDMYEAEVTFPTIGRSATLTFSPSESFPTLEHQARYIAANHARESGHTELLPSDVEIDTIQTHRPFDNGSKIH